MEDESGQLMTSYLVNTNELTSSTTRNDVIVLPRLFLFLVAVPLVRAWYIIQVRISLQVCGLSSMVAGLSMV